MMPADFDAAGAAVLAWLLTYAIHSTILLTGAAIVAWRFADHHAWLDVIWKTALVGPIVTATLLMAADVVPLGGRWSMPAAEKGAGDLFPENPTTNNAETPPDPLVSRSFSKKIPGPLPQPVVRAWPAIAASTWLAIAVFGLARYGIRLRRVYRGVGSGTPVTAPELLQTIDALSEAAQDRRAITLTSSDAATVPLALAGRRIVLPARFLDQLDADQQRAALAHEMAHVVRRDPAWRIAAGILEHALFFQPLNRIARARLGDSAEFLSDQWAVQQTQSPLALARCLAVVASWSSAANDELAVGVSAMARSDSAMIRRVTRILSEPALATPRPRLFWLAIPLALVAMAAPRVTATQLPAAAVVTPVMKNILNAAKPSFVETAEQSRTPRREFTAAEIAAAQSGLRVFRPAVAGDSLENRWRWALAEAKRQRLSDYWVVYSFETDVHAQDLVMTDTRSGTIISSGGDFESSGPPLTALLPDGRGNLVALFRYRGDTIEDGGYRSAGLGFEFRRTPVFWLGYADESQSFDRVRALFEQARDEKIQDLMIELASIHQDTNRVLPFLTGLLEPSRPAAIRSEAAEGLGHHHDPRSVEILLRLARTDRDPEVRSEAAETIGEVQTPQSIPALENLVAESDDPEVRREAAEAFGEQPAASAIPAIERALSTNNHDDVLGELVEALGDIEGGSVLAVLVQTANTHPNRSAQQEAVETLGDIDEPGVVDALMRIALEHDNVVIQSEAVETLGDKHEDAGAVAALERILRDHPSEEVQAEAIETLADASGPVLHEQILALATGAPSARIRSEAIESIGDALEEISDARAIERAEQALERAIFDDVDSSVREEALDAASHLPRDRARRLLQAVIDRHPNAHMRKEAAEHLRERQQ